MMSKSYGYDDFEHPRNLKIHYVQIEGLVRAPRIISPTHFGTFLRLFPSHFYVSAFSLGSTLLF